MKSVRLVGALLCSWTFGCAGPDVGDITIVSPRNGDEINGPIDIVVEIDRSKETYWEVSIEDHNQGIPATWPAQKSVAWENLTQNSGEVEIRASVRNREGELIEDVITVTLNHPLTMEVQVTPSTTKQGVMDVAAVSTGPDQLVAGEIFVDGASYGSSEWPVGIEWDIKREQDGVHTIRAEAQRLDGAMVTEEIEYTSSACMIPPTDQTVQAFDVVAYEDGTTLIAYPDNVSDRIARWSPADGLERDWVVISKGEGVIVDLSSAPNDAAYFITRTNEGASQLYRVGKDDANPVAVDGAPAEMYKVHAMSDGRVYVLGRGPINQQQELHLWTQTDGWTMLGEPYTLATPAQTALFVDSQERLWVAYANRVYRHQIDGSGAIGPADEFTGVNVFAFGEDENGQLLTLTTGAVERRNPGDFLVTETLFDPENLDWYGYGMTHVKHQPDCHTILAARGDLVALASDVAGTP